MHLIPGLLPCHAVIKAEASINAAAVQEAPSSSSVSAQPLLQRSAGSVGMATGASVPGSGPSDPRLSARLRVDFKDITFNELIGKGSFKTVYRGRWSNTAVAVVCMRRGGMVTEARMMQSLSTHPNLVQFYRQAT